MLMPKQMTDAALRRQIAQWTRAALKELVEDDRWSGEAMPIVERAASSRRRSRLVSLTQWIFSCCKKEN